MSITAKVKPLFNFGTGFLECPFYYIILGAQWPEGGVLLNKASTD